MRRFICAATVTVFLWGFAVPVAQAANTTVIVHGQDLANAGLFYNSGDCAGWANDPIGAGASATVYAAYRKPGLIGQRAIGWEFGADGGVTGSEAGPLAYLGSPGALSRLTFSAYLGDASATSEGDLVAFLSPSGNFSDDNYYVGSARLDATASNSWNTWSDQSGRTLTWYHWLGTAWEDDNPADGTPDTLSATIPSLAQETGGSSTAYVGPELGCSGRTWYADDLKVGTSAGIRTYDFEGVLTGSVFGGWHHETDPSSALDWHLKHFTRNYGETEWVVGYSGYYNDLATSSNRLGHFTFFRGDGSLYARHYGSKRWRKVATKTFTVKGVAVFALKDLSKHASYYFGYGGSQALSASRSQIMSVDVRAALHGRLVNKTVYKGARLTVTGQRLPGDKGVKVVLQRRVSRHWHTIATTRTVRHGTFRVGARAGSLGTWTMRLAVGSAKGNLGNHTKPFSLRIKQHPAPPPASAPVLNTPAPTACTNCAGGGTIVPIGGKLVLMRRAGSHHRATPLEAALGTVPLRAPEKSMPRRLIDW